MERKERITLAMSRLITIFFTIILSTMLMPSIAFCHGWGGYEQGAKAHGFGGAFTGLADDPTAVYYNPAGIVQLDGTQGSLGFSIVNIKGQYESSGTSGIDSAGEKTDLENQYFFIPNLYITSKINDRLVLGFGEYTVFGLGFKWPDSFEGRFASGGKNAELSSMTLSPVTAYKITDNLSVALGGRVERAELTLQNKLFVAPGVDEVGLKISGDDFGIGWNASVFDKINDNFKVGFCYRSKLKHSFDDVDFKFNPQIPTLGSIPVGLTNTSAKLDITMPQYVSAGIAWNKGPLTLTTDVYWWDWSQLKDLKFELKQPVAGSSSVVSPMKWDDTWTWAIGTEYKVNALDRVISLRGGFMYEQCPTPSDTVNPAGFQGDNLLYNIGLGTMLGPVYSDFFFTYVYTKDQTWNNASGAVPNPGGGPITGEFKNYRTFMIGNNITYKF
jgi:long-chain fatty acid transport protein